IGQRLAVAFLRGERASKTEIVAKNEQGVGAILIEESANVLVQANHDGGHGNDGHDSDDHPNTVSSDRVLCWRRESNARRVLSLISSRTVDILSRRLQKTPKPQSAKPRWDPVWRPGSRDRFQRTVPQPLTLPATKAPRRLAPGMAQA